MSARRYMKSDLHIFESKARGRFMKNNYGHWISLAEQYLKTSKLIMEQIIQHENKWFMIDDKPIKWEEYFEKTKWSDFNTFVPSIFLLIHGFELLIKGLVLYCGGSIKNEHDVTKMMDFLRNDSRIDNELIRQLEGYIGLSPSNVIIQEFISVNNHLRTDKLHIDIRYPQNNKGETDFSPLRYKEKSLISDIEVIVSEIDRIYSKALSVTRSN